MALPAAALHSLRREQSSGSRRAGITYVRTTSVAIEICEVSGLLAADLAGAVCDRDALEAGGAGGRAGAALDLAALELRTTRAGDAVVRDAGQARRARIVRAAVLADAGTA